LQNVSVDFKLVVGGQKLCRLLDRWLLIDLARKLRCERSEDFRLETLFYRVEGFLRAEGFDVWEVFAERGQAEEEVVDAVGDVDGAEFLFSKCAAYPIR
jgi:hypothetical protein